MVGDSRGRRALARAQIYLRTIHRFVYYRVPPGSSPILANFSIRKLSGAITFDWKGLFSMCKQPLEAKGLFFRFDTRVGAVSGGAGAWLGPKYIYIFFPKPIKIGCVLSRQCVRNYFRVLK